MFACTHALVKAMLNYLVYNASQFHTQLNACTSLPNASPVFCGRLGQPQAHPIAGTPYIAKGDSGYDTLFAQPGLPIFALQDCPSIRTPHRILSAPVLLCQFERPPVVSIVHLPRADFEILLYRMHKPESKCYGEERENATYLWEISGHHSSIREFPPSQALESLGRRLGTVKLHKDLAHACGLFATTTRPGDLEIDDGAELGALISDVLANFCI